MTKAEPDIQPSLESSLEGLTLEEHSYREGPRWELGSSPALEYPPLPDEEPDDDSCCLLGWPLHEVLGKLITAAGCKHESQIDGFLEALLYLWYEGKNHHIWATSIPKDNCKGVDPPTDSADDDFWFVTISCSKKKNSADSRFDKRLSAAQFQWLRDVLGQDPCWVMTERSLYTIVGRGVWARGPCCDDVRQGGSSNLKEAHLVDLETGKWVCDQGRKE